MQLQIKNQTQIAQTNPAQTSSDPFKQYRPRHGAGRGLFRRLVSLVGIVLIVIALGLLLAGLVIGIAVFGSFLLENLSSQ